MKKYEKPVLTVSKIVNSKAIATSLDEWLTTNGLDGAGITTYNVTS